MSPRSVADYKVLVGLEIHVQLATESKMFTAAKNGFGGEPNAQVDPVVLGLPGVLPVMNKRAVEYSIKAGLALGCKIAEHCKWDRKSYYYPDLPKNYQISQYDQPLCGEGVFELEVDGEVRPIRIRRAHLEEDAGKLLHDAPGGYEIDFSIVDLNRAGTPLLEIVTEPDFATAKEVAAFGQELQRLVQFLGISHGQMQMGHMRFEPNINVHITDADGNVHKTAITEIKNLNSFSVLEKATDYEVRRQIQTWLETGELGRKSTYGWDAEREQTVLQREKEEAHDYRYFPDPDLVPVRVSEAWLTEIKASIGELPRQRRARYAKLGLPGGSAAVIAADKATGDYFDAVVNAGAEPKRALALVDTLREIAGNRREEIADLPLTPARVAEVGLLVQEGKVQASKETGRKILEALIENDRPADAAATDLGLIQSNDTGPVDEAIDKLIADNPQPLQDYRGGKQAAFGALVGMVMRNGKGLNPKLVQQRLREKLA
ncbi:MAG: Asp-tRNA(Asn)/Glu-tRNA(Gln) amidotransferase subunit GatB [Planctomycetota bacterium]